MQKPRRKRQAGTVAAGVSAFQAAGSVIEPPKTVTIGAAALEHWAPIMRSRAREEWSESDLLHAANLARAFADIERISAEIAAEGDVIENLRGTPIANPKHAILETLSRRALALSRILHLDAASSVRKENVVKLRQSEREARKAIAEAAGDSLLA